MNHTISCRLAAILCACMLAACSDKHAEQSAAASASLAASAPTKPAAVAPAPAPAPTTTEYVKHAELDCDNRKIVLDATCSNLYSPELMVCSRQSLTVLDNANGEEIGKREFRPSKHDGDTRAVVEEKIGALSCTRSTSGERYIVAEMFNGGNCEQCEWNEVYDWQGKLVGSSRDRSKRSKLVADLVSTSRNAEHVIGRSELEHFYSVGKQ
ncbi:hypothetical protein [Massilia rhizosphaerae]|uniref:hypothetical protein n=1 Tax=Massilia rhizosphaerae TaxID=2784389 RepID=UPI0018DC1F22|nr:hypothetical protein [Massilia rhizosphaerae]